ncbi:MAG: hypothetical protein VBE63_19200 [Lamprobacter sp.]|uniref:hypothetical protein n=1 Tax=Lamprobacter sp. TaxID=3100796 RepID=UPI002B26089F|nr:hypothetical protein [Lamprobacter sp.]MEA3642044.1 hypothetical protein [Lamprobacter sp.]
MIAADQFYPHIFCATGSDDHDPLQPLSGWDLDEILRLIDQKKNFLHAPRSVKAL